MTAGLKALLYLCLFLISRIFKISYIYNIIGDSDKNVVIK